MRRDGQLRPHPDFPARVFVDGGDQIDGQLWDESRLSSHPIPAHDAYDLKLLLRDAKEAFSRSYCTEHALLIGDSRLVIPRSAAEQCFNDFVERVAAYLRNCFADMQNLALADTPLLLTGGSSAVPGLSKAIAKEYSLGSVFHWNDSALRNSIRRRRNPGLGHLS